MLADFSDSLHIDIDFNAEFLSEQINQLDCRSGRTASEPPNVGVENVNAVDDGHHARCQTVAGCTVGVEVNRHFDIGLEFRDDRCGTQGVDQSGHVLECDNLCSEGLHLTGFLNEIFVSKYLFWLSGFLPEQTSKETFLRFFDNFRIDCIAYRTVGNAAQLVDQAD